MIPGPPRAALWWVKSGRRFWELWHWCSWPGDVSLPGRLHQHPDDCSREMLWCIGSVCNHGKTIRPDLIRIGLGLGLLKKNLCLKSHVCWQGFSNLASDWLAAVLPANQQPCFNWNFLLTNMEFNINALIIHGPGLITLPALVIYFIDWAFPLAIYFLLNNGETWSLNLL